MMDEVTITYITRDGKEYPMRIPRELNDKLWDICFLPNNFRCINADYFFTPANDYYCLEPVDHTFPYHIATRGGDHIGEILAVWRN